MNREHWRAMLPIITAFVEGKTVQFRQKTDAEDIWVDADIVGDIPVAVNGAPHWRIKPTPSLRPWKLEEVPVGAVVRNKNTGLKTVILAAEARGNQGLSHVFIHGFFLTEEQILDHWELLDGSPCGVEVSE